MKEKYLLDTINDKTLIKLIDETLTIQKNAKIKNQKINLFKIIPAVAAVALVIGVANILPAFVNNADTGDGNVGSPGVYASPISISEPEEEIELFLPVIVEKSFFENKILSVMPEGRAYSKITAYYIFNPADDYSWEMTADGIITTYSLSDNTTGQFYVLDPNITARESEQLLEYLCEYTDLSGNDIIQMYNNFGVLKTETPDPYTHVRFGETKEILLLDIEWHTYESYQEYWDNGMLPWVNAFREQRNTDIYMQSSDEDKEYYSEENIERLFQKDLNMIKNNEMYYAKSVNGKNVNYACSDPPQYTDSNGYIVFYVYMPGRQPLNRQVYFYDENGIYQVESFEASSKNEYTRILKDKIIPFCDDLLARGLITQEYYDNFTQFDPLAYYVDLYF